MHCLAIDIEKLGDHQDAHIIAVGFCLGDSNGNIIDTKAYYISPDENTTIEPRCKTEFWDKHQGLYEFFLSKGKPAGQVYSDIEYWLSSLESEYPNIVILSDNPAYDLSGFDRMMHKYTGRLPIRYTTDDTYRWVVDYSERAYALGIEKQIKELAFSRMKMSEDDKHHPEKDAEFIYYCTCFTQKVIDKVGNQVASICSKVDFTDGTE